ncbi:hypothetical protein, partial [Rhodanobacter sp. 115]|uniref:hypothetical protein n=1 Tax=Rhodanobacter sp. FW021-MT20 TaxID=1162282 RepID=UPI001ED8ED36
MERRAKCLIQRRMPRHPRAARWVQGVDCHQQFGLPADPQSPIRTTATRRIGKIHHLARLYRQGLANARNTLAAGPVDTLAPILDQDQRCLFDHHAMRGQVGALHDMPGRAHAGANQHRARPGA